MFVYRLPLCDGTHHCAVRPPISSQVASGTEDVFLVCGRPMLLRRRFVRVLQVLFFQMVSAKLVWLMVWWCYQDCSVGACSGFHGSGLHGALPSWASWHLVGGQHRSSHGLGAWPQQCGWVGFAHSFFFALQFPCCFEWLPSGDNWSDGISRDWKQDPWHRRNHFACLTFEPFLWLFTMPFPVLLVSALGLYLSASGFKISLWEALRRSGYRGGGLGPLEWSAVSLQSLKLLANFNQPQLFVLLLGLWRKWKCLLLLSSNI